MIHAGIAARSAMAKMKSGDTGSDRGADELRGIEVTLDFTPNALASLMFRQGDTMVLACATKAAGLPRWFPRNAERGWVHAEYALLPGSTDSRFRRERNGAKGGGLKRLSGWSPAHCAARSTLRNSVQSRSQ